MDTVVLREKDEWGRLTKESRTVTPTDYGVSAAEYALTVGSYPPPPPQQLHSPCHLPVLQIIGFLAWNQDMRESVGETCMESVMYCMQVLEAKTHKRLPF
jgi:hypothetical protein